MSWLLRIHWQTPLQLQLGAAFDVVLPFGAQLGCLRFISACTPCKRSALFVGKWLDWASAAGLQRNGLATMWA